MLICVKQLFERMLAKGDIESRDPAPWGCCVADRMG